MLNEQLRRCLRLNDLYAERRPLPSGHALTHERTECLQRAVICEGAPVAAEGAVAQVLAGVRADLRIAAAERVARAQAEARTLSLLGGIIGGRCE